MIVVSVIEREGTFRTFVTTDEGDSAPESTTILFGTVHIETTVLASWRSIVQNAAGKVARAINASLYLGPPEDHSLDVDLDGLTIESEMPEGVSLYLATHEIGQAP